MHDTYDMDMSWNSTQKIIQDGFMNEVANKVEIFATTKKFFIPPKNLNKENPDLLGCIIDEWLG